MSWAVLCSPLSGILKNPPALGKSAPHICHLRRFRQCPLVIAHLLVSNACTGPQGRFSRVSWFLGALCPCARVLCHVFGPWYGASCHVVRVAGHGKGLPHFLPCLALPALSCRPKGKRSDCYPVSLAIFLQSTLLRTGSGPSSSRPSPCPVGVPPWPMCASSARERVKPREYLGRAPAWRGAVIRLCPSHLLVICSGTVGEKRRKASLPGRPSRPGSHQLYQRGVARGRLGSFTSEALASGSRLSREGSMSMPAPWASSSTGYHAEHWEAAACSRPGSPSARSWV